MVEILKAIETVLWDFWGVLSEMAPYLLFGFLVAGWLSVLVPPRLVGRHLGGCGIWPVVKAAAIGVPLPLCSCGVIPVSASLRRYGASRGATTAFLISTPQTGVDSIFVTYSLLGWVFAIFRPIVALISGVVGGTLVSLAERNRSGEVETIDTDSNSSRAAGGRGKFYQAFAYGFGTLPRDIGRDLLVGLAIAALISALVPKGYLATVLGGGIVAMLIMMLLGIPIYVCATASVPLAWALINKGVSPGAALVFLMTGPATNAATIAVIWKTMGRRTALVYLLTVALCALGAGLTLDYFFKVVQISPQPGMGWMLPQPVKWACTIVLLSVLVLAVFRGAPKEEFAAPGDEILGRINLQIEGMTCSHCTETVRQALLETEGVKFVQVDLSREQATVMGKSLDVDSLRQAVERAGYRLKSTSSQTAPEPEK